MAKGWNIDPAAFAGLVAEDVKLRQRKIAIQLLNEIVQRSPVETRSCGPSTRPRFNTTKLLGNGTNLFMPTLLT